MGNKFEAPKQVEEFKKTKNCQAERCPLAGTRAVGRNDVYWCSYHFGAESINYEAITTRIIKCNKKFLELAEILNKPTSKSVVDARDTLRNNLWKYIRKGIDPKKPVTSKLKSMIAGAGDIANERYAQVNDCQTDTNSI